ncbi:uncharacterized protein [Neodiprion pinetum]|uniref:uncharacterized protein n=1 Tax=Neodiprion pinetum TaxID=441929 RepID=UPI0037170550
MFRQIIVREEDRDFQRILWRTDETQPVRKYHLNTVTYGTAPAPYLAIRCLRQLATEETNTFPRATRALREDFHMDDVITGQFHLRKWRASDRRILENISKKREADSLLTIDKEGPMKTLGLLWDSNSDTMQYSVKIDETSNITKRVVLSKIAQIFDLLGLLGPIQSQCVEWKKNGPLSVKEFKKAEKAIIRLTQQEALATELQSIEQGAQVIKTSKIASINPYIDSEGLLRVGGRLSKADIPETQKLSIILPTRHLITKMILKKEHIQLHRCGPENLLCSIRSKYWPLSGRREARKVTNGCLLCFRNKPKTPEVMMGDLPSERPVHLELVTELTSETFLAALRRFVARRGVCSQIISDNGTNFVGAVRESKEVFEFLEKEENTISEHLSQQKITWKFIPLRAPHFGGVWKAAVKITKRQLNTVPMGLVSTFEEYYTLLVEIESILNSRPLTPLSSDPNDTTAMTPAHFLIGDTLILPAEHNYLETSDNRLSRWQHLQKRRGKWWTKTKNIEIGALVLLKEDNAPPLQWKLGRVVEIHLGTDGVVRVVAVKTATGTFKRAVKKIYPLPIDRDNSKFQNSLSTFKHSLFVEDM